MKLRVCVAGVAGILTMSLLALAESSETKSGVRLNLDAPAPSAPATTTTKKATPAQKPVGTSTSSTAAGTKVAPAKTAPGKAAKKSKDEPPPKIEGLEVPRGEKGFLGIKVDGGFRVSFYGPDRKPIVADVSQIVMRWPVKYQPNDERTLLTPVGDGKVLASDRIVRPPYHFKLYLTLLKSPDDPTPETYVVDFSQ